MKIDDFQKINWLEPWCFTTAGLERELIREVSSKHPLYGVHALAIGRRKDNDDVLFFLVDHQPPLALVHLIWRYEDNPKRPRTVFYESIQDFIDRRMKVDYLFIKALMKTQQIDNSISRIQLLHGAEIDCGIEQGQDIFFELLRSHSSTPELFNSSFD